MWQLPWLTTNENYLKLPDRMWWTEWNTRWQCGTEWVAALAFQCLNGCMVRQRKNNKAESYEKFIYEWKSKPAGRKWIVELPKLRKWQCEVVKCSQLLYVGTGTLQRCRVPITHEIAEWKTWSHIALTDPFLQQRSVRRSCSEYY